MLVNDAALEWGAYSVYGKYYQVTLSISKGNVATVYNVVLKNKGNAPVRNNISAIGSKTVGAFPNNSVPQNAEKSNIIVRDSPLNYERIRRAVP